MTLNNARHSRSLHSAVMCFSLLLASTLFLQPASAQTVKDYEPGVSRDGVVYFMPKTAIDVTFTTTRITTTPGELCKYADRYMHLSDVATAEDTHYELTTIGIAPAAVADETKCYHVPFTPGTPGTEVQLSEINTLLAIRTDNPYVAAATTPDAPVAAAAPLDPRLFMSEEMLMVSSKAKLAELVAREIYEIRDSKSSLMRGESDYMPADGEGLKLMTANLQKQEDALMQLFTGVTTRETLTRTIRIIPDEAISKQVLARFSRKLGLLDADNLAGSPIFIDVQSLALNTTDATSAPADDNAKAKKARTYEGIVYNIPVKASVRIYAGATTYIDDKLSVAQFGTTETLSTRLFTKKTTTKVILDPLTGALLKIEE